MRQREAVSQSLAGRTAILRLLPLSISELETAGIADTRDEYIYQGFMPRLYSENVDPLRLYRSYYQTYIERDVRQIVNTRRLTDFEHFIRLLAGRVGQVLNLNALSGDLGVSGTTLKEWLSALEASHAVFRLHPYFENFAKGVFAIPEDRIHHAKGLRRVCARYDAGTARRPRAALFRCGRDLSSPLPLSADCIHLSRRQCRV